ncbi:hypothetical protein BRD17_04745 [Halobacteriales archaeon SW_7_68_16]|nr:MAG: hypothetical protein BRD17_04745 [Halobacteriales archaeon SW_7_68_16]
MSGLFRRTKRATGVLVALLAVGGGVGVLVDVGTMAGVVPVSVLALGAGYSLAVLVSLLAGRNPRRMAYLFVAAAGLLVVLSAVTDRRGTMLAAAGVLFLAGAGLVWAGRPRTVTEKAG